MKKIISIAFAAILAGLAISCQKEEAVSDKTDAVQYTFNITVNEQVGFDNDTATKGGTSESHKTAWENGDKIFLFFKPTSGSLLTDTYATLTYNESSWSGAFNTDTPSLGEGGTLSAVYVYKLDGSVTPAYSNSKWTIATGNTFYNCQTGVSYTVSGSEISATLNLEAPTNFVQFYVTSATGVLTCDKVKGWKDIAIGSDMAISNVTCTGYMDGFANSGDSNVKEYYGRIVDGTSLNGKACEFSVVKNGKVYERSATPSSDARSFKMTVSTPDWPEAAGKLPGLFTMGKGADGKAGTVDDVQVRFSKGNLYAKKTGDNWTWNFYDEQYKFLAADMEERGSSNVPQRQVSEDEIEIDLFTWGYDATNSVNPIGSTGIGGHTTDGDKQFSASEDWGSQIGDGSTWRTLSIAEWTYLFNTRTDASNKVGFATVGDVNGIIILPDTFIDPMKNGGSAAFVPKSTTGWSANVYTTGGNWEAMESAGAVFLPAAGSRSGSDVYDVGVGGYYWSSTADDSDYAYPVYFLSDGVDLVYYGDRSYGYSVRLITDASAAPAPTPTTTGTAKRTGDIDVNWVQLWAGGPKFAEYNVGASSATETGTTMTFTDAIKAGAEYVWGANWCTPSKDQMDELLKAATDDGSEKVNCVYTQENSTWGFKFTGKETGYTGNSVFFPAQDGENWQGGAYYWSGTASGSEAWNMYLYYIEGDWGSDWNSYDQGNDFLVRPVLKN